MFRRLKKFLHNGGPSLQTTLVNDKEGLPCAHELHLAVLALLIEAAASDSDIPKEEAEVVCALMQDQFGFADELIPELIEEAVTMRREHGKLDSFIKTINDRFNEDQRQLIFAMIWKVLLADGQLASLERRAGKKLQFRLLLDDDKADEARMLASSGKV